jgi:hypothetical protein
MLDPLSRYVAYHDMMADGAAKLAADCRDKAKAETGAERRELLWRAAEADGAYVTHQNIADTARRLV